MNRFAINRAGRGIQIVVGVVLVLLVAFLLAVVLMVTATGHSATAGSAPASPAAPISSTARTGHATVQRAPGMVPCRIRTAEMRRAIDFLGARKPTTAADLLAVCKLYGAS